jgi:hypothetical protein
MAFTSNLILYDGLIQCHVRSMGCNTRFLFNRLPLHICNNTWEHYNYTLSDVERTLYSFDTHTCVACMRVLCPPDNTNPNISINMTSTCSKSVIIDKILNHVRDQLNKNTINILTSTSFHQVPMLPVIDVDSILFMKYVQMTQRVSMVDMNYRNEIVTYKGRMYVPVEQVDTEVLAYRVIPADDFIYSMRYHRPCRLNNSFDVCLNDEFYKGCDEGVIFRFVSSAQT